MVLQFDVGFVATQPDPCPIANGDREAECNELPPISIYSSLIALEFPQMAHPCQNDRIIIVADPFHYAYARDES